jgi:drug/metabolite transporter (DMT)-like permease
MPRQAPIIKPVEDRPLVGISFVVLAVACFSGLDTVAKYLAVTGTPVLQVVLMRFLMAFVLVLVVFLPQHGTQLFYTRNPKLELARALMLLLTSSFNFMALRYLPLTVTAAISFSAPLLITALSIPLLRERVGWRRWVAIFVGFVGVLIVVRPGGTGFHWAMLLSIAATFAFAFLSIINRSLAGVDSVHTQQFYSMGVAVIFLTPVAIPIWIWPDDMWVWFWFLAMGVLAFVGHLLMTAAFRYASASTLAPFNYPQIIFMSVLSWLIFSQPPDIAIYVGAPLVVGSGLYVWFRERRLSLERAMTPPG